MNNIELHICRDSIKVMTISKHMDMPNWVYSDQQ